MRDTDAEGLTIARVWRGTTPESKADEYFGYMMRTGVRDLRATEGNTGVYVLRRQDRGKAEFLLISLWDSPEAIERFAGPDIEKAVYYPEDEKFLLELQPQVTHYSVLEGP